MSNDCIKKNINLYVTCLNKGLRIDSTKWADLQFSCSSTNGIATPNIGAHLVHQAHDTVHSETPSTLLDGVHCSHLSKFANAKHNVTTKYCGCRH